MLDELWKWMGEHTPFLLLVSVLVVAAIAITWRASHWVHRIKKTESECEKIEGHLSPKLLSINSSLNTLNGNFNSLVVYLKGKDGAMDTSLFISKSPIQLTDLGVRILDKIGGREFIDNNIEDLIKEMNAQGIKTALDSQTYAPMAVTQLSSTDSFNKIKDYAFKNPYYKEVGENGIDISVPLDMGTITNILGIYLRDKYLERNVHLNPADIP